MRKDENDRPSCCQRGNEYILRYGKGWEMCTGYSIDGFEYDQISYCPFCGKKLNLPDEEKDNTE